MVKIHVSGEKPSPLAAILLPFAANSSQRPQGNKRALAFSLFRVAMIPCLQRPGSPYRSLLATNAEIHACCSPYRPLLTTRTKIQPPQETQAPCGWANPDQGPVQRNGPSGGLPRPEEWSVREDFLVRRNGPSRGIDLFGEMPYPEELPPQCSVVLIIYTT